MKRIILSLLTVAILGLTGCNKHEVVPAPVTTSHLGTYFSDNVDDAKQNFTVNAVSGGLITGTNGVRITVPGNAFVYSNGNPVVGEIDFELIEVLEVSDMVLLNKTTSSNGEILVSGGQIKLTATQNSSQVFVANGMAVDVKIPVINIDNQMELFVGNENSSGDVNWTSSFVDTTQQDTITILNDSTNVSYYNFDFNTDSLGWINCDYFWNNANPDTDVTAQLDTIYNFSNTVCYLVFPNINSVMPLYESININDGAFSGYNIPTGQAVTFVCISEIDGIYYSSFVTSTIVSNHIENITMIQTTVAGIQTDIDNL